MSRPAVAFARRIRRSVRHGGAPGLVEELEAFVGAAEIALLERIADTLGLSTDACLGRAGAARHRCWFCKQVFDDRLAEDHFGSRFTREKLRRLPNCVIENHPAVKAMRKRLAAANEELAMWRRRAGGS